jgi:hypothetical protein
MNNSTNTSLLLDGINKDKNSQKYTNVSKNILSDKNLLTDKLLTNNDNNNNIIISIKQVYSITQHIHNYLYSMNKLSKWKEKLNVKSVDHIQLLKYNYSVTQLKQIAKEYKIKIAGNKEELIIRNYFYLYLSFYAIKIQKLFRGSLQRNYIHKHGPAFKDRSLCTNSVDFLTMDELTSISPEQFFSFKDEDGFIYGFDVVSLHNLIFKSKGPIKNPFNTKPLSANVINNFKSFIRCSKILKINITTEIVDVLQEVSIPKSIELRALSLFQIIDSLGNYSSSNWFMSLNQFQLVKYMDELFDIWCYRANLSPEIKQAICYPSGNPFMSLSRHYLRETENIDEKRRLILDVIERMVTTGVDKDSKCLGAYYVLGALTLVNQEAAIAMPWLYEAAYHI